jgi:hypothetical protein
MKEPMPSPPPPDKTGPIGKYEPPRITSKQPLKQFTGSPLMGGPLSPDDLLGLPPGSTGG